MNEPIDRRDFARELAAAAASSTALLGGSSLAADDPKSPATADQLLAILKARFPDRLSDEQWKEVRGKLEAQLKASQTLSEFKLQNSDEPATVFAVYRKG